MKFNSYQNQAIQFDVAQHSRDICGGGFIEKVLGLAGEAGETADKFKKVIRDKGGHISKADREAIIMELGDVLWYLSAIATYLEVPLDTVAQDNIKKLEERRRQNKIHGEGDER